MIQGLYTSLSGLMAMQKGVNTTSNNIANVNTEGYSKENISFSTNPPKTENNVQIGTGVTVNSIYRSHNEFLFTELRNTTSEKNNQENTYKMLKELEEEIVGFNDEINLSTLMEEVINNVQDHQINDNSISLSNLENSLSNFSDRTEQLNNIFNNKLFDINTEKTELINKSNNLLENLENINKEIMKEEANGKTIANTLRDNLDSIELELSEIGNFKSYNKTEGNNKQYSFEFEMNSGKLQSLEDTFNIIENIKDKLNNVSDNFIELTQKYINKEVSYENYMEADYTEDYSKQMDNIFIEFSNSNDLRRNNVSSTISVLEQLQQKNDNLTKVNLDTEMVNMLKFEKAYAANAKVIQTIDEMLETLLNMKK